MAPTPNDTLQSVRIEKDGSVVLSIYAPQAQNVRIGVILFHGEKS